jgi:ubiquinone/menaquinone biosynthesis C-methylase UbiE
LPWNHNIHYHGVVLRSIPPNCAKALDVGCGCGQVAREISRHCAEVTAIDIDRDSIAQATSRPTTVNFLQADVMTADLPPASFDFISAVATLHHLPLRPALTRLQNLLRPGGTLAVIGLYRQNTIMDSVNAAIALPISRVLRLFNGYEEMGAPMQPPKETLTEIRNAAPIGASVRRLLLFRYSLIWRKPTDRMDA